MMRGTGESDHLTGGSRQARPFSLSDVYVLLAVPRAAAAADDLRSPLHRKEPKLKRTVTRLQQRRFQSFRALVVSRIIALKVYGMDVHTF